MARGASPEQVLLLEQDLRLAKLKLAGIEAISRALVSEQTVEEILESVMERTTQLLNAERATLYILDDTGQQMWSKVMQGDGVHTIELKVGEGIAGWVAQHRRTVNVKDAYKDPRFNPDVDKRSDFKTRSILCQPMVNSRQRLVGVVQVLNKQDGYFTPGDEDLLSAIASQAAIAVQNSALYSGIVSKNIALLEAQLRLKERRAELELLFRIERAAATSMTRELALLGVMDACLTEFPCEVGAIVLNDPDVGDAFYELVLGPGSEALHGKRIKVGGTIVEMVLRSGETIVMSEPDHALLGAELKEHLPIQEYRTLACIPIAHRNERLGCLQLFNRLDDPRGFSERDIRILDMIGSRIALSFVLGRALEEEHKAERLAAIGQTLSGVVHDLKTPLTIINGYAQLVAKEDDGAARDDIKDKIQKQIKEIRGMTNELLAFARGESELLLRKVFISTFIKELTELLQGEFEEAGVSLSITSDFNGSLRMDESKMKRVVYNLARNALEATGDGGDFGIHITKGTRDVILTFKDDGPGIPNEIAGRLFESFATFGKENGTGLGLAIVKKFIEEHSGSIYAESEPGEGTTFTVTLPAS
jgi:signal transduction histidine kinase/putative methionine-R-sulfoxide reductase with GAF domain